MRPFTRATPSQIGCRSASPAAFHVKRRWSSYSVANPPEGAVFKGAGRATPTPVATTPFSAASKAWNSVSEIPKDTSNGSVTGTMGYPLPHCVPHPLYPCLVVGGRLDIPPTPFLLELGVDEVYGPMSGTPVPFPEWVPSLLEAE